MLANAVPLDLDGPIKRIYDHLYGNAAVRTPAGVAKEVGKLIRTATHVERGAGLYPAFSLSPDTKRKILAGDVTAIKLYGADVRKQFSLMNNDWKLYEDNTLLLSDHDIAWCCAQLDGLVVSAAKRDVFGDAVEIFRTSWAKQSSGQFFTDPRVTHLSMRLLRFDPFHGDDLVDICCGTGGFLLAGLDHIRKLAESNLPEKGREQAIIATGLRSLHGQEVDPEICEIANASLACRLSGDEKPLVQHGDSLRPFFISSKDPGAIRPDLHRCAASNPPFGTKITVKDPEVLKQFDLAKGGGTRVAPRAPDILLLERNIKILKPGKGRLVIVIPYQILSGPQTKYIREWLLRHTHLEAVVDLPAETFQPHTGTKTSLLLVRRRVKPIDNLNDIGPDKIFMSTPKWIGHDRRGNPVYARDPEGNRTATILSDIEDVGRAFELYCGGEEPSAAHEESFSIPATSIVSDPDLRLNARYFRNISSDSDHLAKRKGWKTIKLGDACKEIFFPTRFKRSYTTPSKSAVPFLGGANITELLADTNKWISLEDAKAHNLLVREGWLLITRSGTTGIVSSVPKAWDGVAMSEHVIRIVPKPDVLSSAWLQAYLRSEFGQRALSRGVFGSVIDEITPEFIANLEIPVSTDRKVISRVTETIQEAEKSRQASIQNFRRAISDLSALL